MRVNYSSGPALFSVTTELSVDEVTFGDRTDTGDAQADSPA